MWQMIDVGIATAAISVERQLRMNMNTMQSGENAAQDQVLLDGVEDSEMNLD